MKGDCTLSEIKLAILVCASNEKSRVWKCHRQVDSRQAARRSRSNSEKYGCKYCTYKDNITHTARGESSILGLLLYTHKHAIHITRKENDHGARCTVYITTSIAIEFASIYSKQDVQSRELLHYNTHAHRHAWVTTTDFVQKMSNSLQQCTLPTPALKEEVIGSRPASH